ERTDAVVPLGQAFGLVVVDAFEVVEGHEAVVIADGDVLEPDAARVRAVIHLQSLEHVRDGLDHEPAPRAPQDRLAQRVVLLAAVGADLHEQRVRVRPFELAEQANTRKLPRDAIGAELAVARDGRQHLDVHAGSVFSATSANTSAFSARLAGLWWS